MKKSKIKKGYTLIEVSVSAVIIALGMGVTSFAMGEFTNVTSRNIAKDELTSSMNLVTQRLEKEIKPGSQVLDSFASSELGTVTSGDNALVVRIPVINLSSGEVLATPPYNRFSYSNPGLGNLYDDILVLEYDTNNGWQCGPNSAIGEKCNNSDYNTVKTAKLLLSYFPAINISIGLNSNKKPKVIRQVIANNIINSASSDELTNPPITPATLPVISPVFSFFNSSGAAYTTSGKPDNVTEIGISLVGRKIYTYKMRFTQKSDIKIKLMNFVKNSKF